jgi:hypothetical protein
MNEKLKQAFPNNEKLQQAIKEHPTLTILRDTSESTEVQFTELPRATTVRDIPIPDSFDGRVVWKGLLTPIAEQGECGSCWAWASSAVLADRFNIQSLGKMHVELSATKMVLCNLLGDEFSVLHPEIDTEKYRDLFIKSLEQGACTGNTLVDAWRYLYVVGTTSTKCIPDNAKTLGITYEVNNLSEYSKNNKLPLCPSFSGPIGDMCADVSVDSRGREYGTPARFYRCFHYYSVAGIPEDNGSELVIRNNIYCWGPVSTGMMMYPDFYTFDAKNEIYEWNGQGPAIGGHAIRIVGWGEEKGKKYWIIANTWGKKWGRGGYFYMVRGTNNCKIEENIVTGIPDFFYPAGYTLPGVQFVWSETEAQKAQREALTSVLTMTGGGIDPTTGFTRRVMVSKPWVDFKPPIKLEELPTDWLTFVAGIQANVASGRGSNSVKQGFVKQGFVKQGFVKQGSRSNSSNYFYFFIGLFGVIVFFFIKSRFRKNI